MRLLPLAAACALVVTTLVSPAATAAPHRGARLVWARGAGAERCVGANGLEEDVKARLGFDPFAMPVELVVEGIVHSTGPGFSAEIVVRDVRGELVGTRLLKTRQRDCRPLGEAVAVAITVAIDPDASGIPSGSNEPSAPGEETAPAPVAAPSRTPSPSTPVRTHTAILVGAGTGLVPDVAAVLSLRAGWRIDPWELGVRATFWPESSVQGLSFGLAAMGLRGCFVPWSRSIVVGWCGELEVGAFSTHVDATNLAPVNVGTVPWMGLESGPMLTIPAGPLRLEVDAAALVPVTRRQAFVRDQSAPVWQQSRVGLRGQLGMGVVF